MLEDMLLKWAVEGKRRSRLSEGFRKPHFNNSSICTTSTSSDPMNHPRNSEEDQEPTALNASKATAVGESRKSVQCLVPEEEAIILRDERLLAASNPNPRQLSISMPPTPLSTRIKLPTPALTVENMELLNREFEVNPFDLLTFTSPNNGGSDSGGLTSPCSTPGEDVTPLEPRRELERNPSSQVTVIALKKKFYR